MLFYSLLSTFKQEIWPLHHKASISKAALHLANSHFCYSVNNSITSRWFLFKGNSSIIQLFLVYDILLISLPQLIFSLESPLTSIQILNVFANSSVMMLRGRVYFMGFSLLSHWWYPGPACILSLRMPIVCFRLVTARVADAHSERTQPSDVGNLE